MITVNIRAKRSLSSNLKSCWFVVCLFSLAFCLLCQMTLGFISFYQSHRSMSGDEISVFMEPGSNTKQMLKILDSRLQLLAPGATITSVSAKDLLKEDILKLVEKNGKVPEIFAIEFPISTPFASIEKMVSAVEEIKEVSLVSANLEWIKKRYTLREALALGVAVFGIPPLILMALIFVICITRLNYPLKQEQGLLLMLGGGSWVVRGPLIEISVLVTLISSLFGAILFFLTTYASVPFLEEAFEIKLLPEAGTNVLICILLAVFLSMYAAICAYITAGRTKPLTF